MINDEFENQLRQVSMREIPADWRGKILKSAEQPERLDDAMETEPKRSRWRDLLWPCPQAWAALACVWLVIIPLNMGRLIESTKTSRTTATNTEEMIRTFAQERLLAGGAGGLGL